MENKNGNEIYKNIKDKSSVNLNYNTILNIIRDFRKYIAEVYKQKYRNRRIGGEPGTNSVFAVDDLIVHDIDGTQKSLIGAIDTLSKEV